MLLNGAIKRRFDAIEAQLGAQLTVAIEKPHQNSVRVREILKLILETIRPLLSVKEVVAEPPYDHQDGQYLVTWIFIAAVENGSDKIWLVGRT